MKVNLYKKTFKYSIYLILLLIVTEILIRFYFPQKTFSIAHEDAISCFKKSDYTVFELTPNCWFHFKNFDTGEKFDIKTNDLGLRGNDIKPDKDPLQKRILIEGDSFTFGFGVKDKETFSYLLEQKLSNANKLSEFNQAQVINAGYAGGFGPDAYYMHLKNKGLELKPDLVIFSVFIYNDLLDIGDDIWTGTGNYGQPQKIKSKKIAVDNGYLLPINAPLIYKIPLIRESHLMVLLSNRLAHFFSNFNNTKDRIVFTFFKPSFLSGDATDENLPGRYYSFCIYKNECHRIVMHLFDDFISVIKASQDLINQKIGVDKTRFLVVLIPADFQLYQDLVPKYQKYMDIPSDLNKESDPYPQKLLKQRLTQENISYLDLFSIFKSDRRRLYYDQDGHWNSQGHAVAAEAIYNWILNNFYK